MLTIENAVAGKRYISSSTRKSQVFNPATGEQIADLPLSTNRNLMNLAASVPGVSQISNGDSQFGSSGNQGTESAGLQFAANGMRTRSNAFIIEADWVPFGKEDSWLHPLANLKLGLQYTAYTQFNGAASNYDGAGRNASDNNTLLLFGWLMF